jgi:hypothetical protein
MRFILYVPAVEETNEPFREGCSPLLLMAGNGHILHGLDCGVEGNQYHYDANMMVAILPLIRLHAIRTCLYEATTKLYVA